MKIKFYDYVEDDLLKFAVVFARYQGKWVYCRHKNRDTYEVPGGHRESGESIEMAAKRELYEETGAVDYNIKPICVYSVEGKTRVNESGEESFGMLFYADVFRFEELPDYEIEEVRFFDDLPEELTYPLIQPVLLKKLQEFCNIKRID
ncbi:NUDIX hydrolase [Anaerosporobacter sp.]